MIRFREFLEEATTARTNRVRAGKLQRRKLVSLRPGYRVQAGKLVRMDQKERMARHRAQVKAARKRKPLLRQILRKRNLSMKVRKRSGLK
jgi:hypothetical protein